VLSWLASHPPIEEHVAGRRAMAASHRRSPIGLLAIGGWAFAGRSGLVVWRGVPPTIADRAG